MRQLEQLDLIAAIGYLEQPSSLASNFAEADQARAWRRIDRLVAEAEATQPLAWQAFIARRSGRPVLGTVEGARRILALEAAGHDFQRPARPAKTPRLRRVGSPRPAGEGGHSSERDVGPHRTHGPCNSPESAKVVAITTECRDSPPAGSWPDCDRALAAAYAKAIARDEG